MTLFIAWLWGIANPTKTAIIKVLIIVFGVIVASVGEIRISWIGVFYQVAGLVFESTRLVMIQVLLSDDGEKMDPLVSLYYFAPVCGAMNLVVVYFTEAGSFHLANFQSVGIPFLVLNAMVAFCLNIASVFLVSFSNSHSSLERRWNSSKRQYSISDTQNRLGKQAVLLCHCLAFSRESCW